MSLFDTGIRPAVDEWLLEKSKEVRDYGNYWSASSAGYCMRKNIFDRLGVPRVEADARKQRVFTAGHLFHDWLQGITKEAGLSIASEVELQDEELMIRGHIDDLVLIKDNAALKEWREQGMPYGHPQTPIVKQHLILYDYKTVNSRSFAYKRDKISHYHRYQLGTYMYMLRKLDNLQATKITEGEATMIPLKDLTEARICNISKDDLRMSESQLLWDDVLENDIVTYWTELNRFWEAKKLPPCTCADYEQNSKTGIGFMADPKYNPFFYKGEPCSLDWYLEQKEAGNLK